MGMFAHATLSRSPMLSQRVMPPLCSRIAIVEDQTIFREMLAEILLRTGRIEIVGQYSTGESAEEALGDQSPDLVLLDALLPDKRGIDVLRFLRQVHPKLSVIIVTAHARPALVQEAVESGARGVVSKTAPLQELATAVDRVLHGGRYFCSVTSSLLADVVESPERGAELTPRQCKVVELVARGLSSKEIAEVLNISEKTVQNHRLQIREKLGIHDVAGLTRFAIERGFIEPRA
jgi:DNA-binding NarL/FixJ family response regulator